MYTISVYDKSKALIATYEHINTINYQNKYMIDVTVSGKELLKHKFPTDCDLQLLSDNGNYSISSSIIGTFEILREP